MVQAWESEDARREQEGSGPGDAYDIISSFLMEGHQKLRSKLVVERCESGWLIELAWLLCIAIEAL